MNIKRQENRKNEYENRVFVSSVFFVDYAEGNLLHNRFKSLQKRNIIESRVQEKYRNEIFMHRNI